MTALYALRFFLDAGAGVCLWSQNDAARDRFSYAIDNADLNLPLALMTDLERLVSDYDATIDWNNPGRAGLAARSGYEPDDSFGPRIVSLAARLSEALGGDFAIRTDYDIDPRQP
ncbi:MAG: hypothetical protein SGJ21_16150 [Alphaproteobacteria bacterium]|nr:hypothetical protein [Alphaproteobacteria bacterium]